jgi:molybdate transport system regulatory protein
MGCLLTGFTESGRLTREESTMRLSTRNQLTGTVAAIDVGSVMAIVKVTLDGGSQQVTASITKDAVEDLGLQQGQPVTVLIKSTEVMLGVE